MPRVRKTLRILVTGTREELTRSSALFIRDALEGSTVNLAGDEVTIIVGDCKTGVDAHVRALGTYEGWTIIEGVAKWKELGKRAGPTRNQWMVDQGADMCLAFPSINSDGTFDCIKRARAANIPTIIHTINDEAFMEEL